MRPKVSVVIPIYNVQPYLKQCIESVRNQTLHDIEIILVDDESPDECGLIADKYADLDERIKVIHRKNGGLGAARNSGIEIATGEYVGFVDSDDWIEQDMYESMYRIATVNGAQVVFTGMKTFSSGTVTETFEQPLSGSSLRGPQEIFELRANYYGALPSKEKAVNCTVSACVGLYSLDCLNKYRIRFNAVRSEDKFFNTAVARKADMISFASGSPYHYRKDNQSSITTAFNNETIDSFNKLYSELYKMAYEEPDEYRDECIMRTRRCIIDYSRELMRMIENSQIESRLKTRYVKQVLNEKYVRSACLNYPFWKLPFIQSVFFIALAIRAPRLARAMIKLKGIR